MPFFEEDYFNYMDIKKKKWQIKDNKIICLQLINKYKLKKNKHYSVFVKINDITKMVKEIMEKEKCGELEATIKLKEELKAKYTKKIDNN